MIFCKWKFLRFSWKKAVNMFQTTTMFHKNQYQTTEDAPFVSHTAGVKHRLGQSVSIYFQEIIPFYKKFHIFWNLKMSISVECHRGGIEQSYLFHGNSLRSVYAPMLQGVCVLDWSLKVSAPHTPNFLNVPTTFNLLFLPKWQFSNKKYDALRQKVDRKLISQTISRDMQKHLFDLYMAQIVTVVAGEMWGKFSNHKTSYSKSLHFDGATLSNFGCVYLTETHTMK